MTFGIGLKQVSSIKKVEDIWESKAACDKTGEGSEAEDEQEKDSKKTHKKG